MNKEDFTRAINLFEEHKRIITILDGIKHYNCVYKPTIKIARPSFDIVIEDDIVNQKAIECIIQSYEDRLICINNQLHVLDINIFEE